MKVYFHQMDRRDLFKIVLNEYGLLFTHVNTIKKTNGSKLGKFTKHQEDMDNKEKPFH